MGVANDRSIAWGIAQTLAGQGAELGFTYQEGSFGRRAVPLAEELGAKIIVPCDVTEPETIDHVFAEVDEKWGGELDFVVHALAFSDRNELKGRYADTSRDNFIQTMVISCFSFTEVAQKAAARMPNGGSMVTLSYLGASAVIPAYNVMGVAKAALETSVLYLANDFGPKGVRVNAISAGPVRTVSGSGVGAARYIFNHSRDHAPLRKTPSLEEIGGSALYLLSDLSAGVTGEIHFVDGGFNKIGMPRISALKLLEDAIAEKGEGTDDV
ncbi:MAG: SDR family oxidoreductase, partial [Pseudomonadota bacterium]